MKVEVKKVDAVKRELKFEIPKERVSQKFDEVYNELGKIVKIADGFTTIAIAENVVITIQKSAIVTSVPKGTLKSA